MLASFKYPPCSCSCPLYTSAATQALQTIGLNLAVARSAVTDFTGLGGYSSGCGVCTALYHLVPPYGFVMLYRIVLFWWTVLVDVLQRDTVDCQGEGVWWRQFSGL